MKSAKEDHGQLRGSPRGSIIPPPRGPEPEFKHHLQGGVWAFRPSPTHKKMIMTFVGYQQNIHMLCTLLFQLVLQALYMCVCMCVTKVNTVAAGQLGMQLWPRSIAELKPFIETCMMCPKLLNLANFKVKLTSVNICMSLFQNDCKP